jgi:hypothetical protein
MQFAVMTGYDHLDQIHTERTHLIENNQWVYNPYAGNHKSVVSSTSWYSKPVDVNTIPLQLPAIYRQRKVT